MEVINRECCVCNTKEINLYRCSRCVNWLCSPCFTNLEQKICPTCRMDPLVLKDGDIVVSGSMKPNIDPFEALPQSPVELLLRRAFTDTPIRRYNLTSFLSRFDFGQSELPYLLQSLKCVELEVRPRARFRLSPPNKTYVWSGSGRDDYYRIKNIDEMLVVVHYEFEIITHDNVCESWNQIETIDLTCLKCNTTDVNTTVARSSSPVSVKKRWTRVRRMFYPHLTSAHHQEYKRNDHIYIN